MKQKREQRKNRKLGNEMKKKREKGESIKIKAALCAEMFSNGRILDKS